MLHDVMSYYETEKTVETLQTIEIEQYGSLNWIKQHHKLSQLNLQAHINAAMRGDEYVMESLATFDKVKTLIHEVVVCEIWKEMLLPLMKSNLIENQGIKSYLSIFHESVLINLLEIVLYHRTAIDAAEDSLLEIVDYSYRYIQKLVSGKIKYKDGAKSVDEIKNMDKERDFDRQVSQIEFNISMGWINMMRYITDNIKYLPISIIRHVSVENDMLMACVVLIEDRPWLRNSPEGREKFEDGKWQLVSKNEMSKLPKIEGNIWIMIYNLLMTEEIAKGYEITDYRKNMLLRLRKYLNDLIIEQIPNLVDMVRTLDQLSIMNTNAQTASNPFVVQQVPELRRRIFENKNWNELAQYQLKNFFNREVEAKEFDELIKFADLYSGQNAEALSEGFRCAN